MSDPKTPYGRSPAETPLADARGLQTVRALLDETNRVLRDLWTRDARERSGPAFAAVARFGPQHHATRWGPGLEAAWAHVPQLLADARAAQATSRLVDPVPSLRPGTVTCGPAPLTIAVVEVDFGRDVPVRTLATVTEGSHA